MKKPPRRGLDTELTADRLRARRRVQAGRARQRRQDLPEDPREQLKGAINRRLRLLDERPRHRLPQDVLHPDTWARRSTCRPWSNGNTGDESGTAWPSLVTPPTARTSSTASSWSTPRARTWSPACARRASDRAQDVFPECYQQLLDVRQTLEREMRDMQDFEFTIERGRLYMLQTRNWQAHRSGRIRIAVDMVDEA